MAIRRHLREHKVNGINVCAVCQRPNFVREQKAVARHRHGSDMLLCATGPWHEDRHRVADSVHHMFQGIIPIKWAERTSFTTSTTLRNRSATGTTAQTKQR
jgi:hypothetical protein